MSAQSVAQVTGKDTGRLDLAMKLLSRAFDPSCGGGEAENAGAKFVRVCRTDGIGLPHLARHLATECRVLPPPVTLDVEPAACDIVMPFGKHRGETLGDIARTDPGYVTWATANLDDDFLAGAFSTVKDYFGGGGE